MITPLLKGRFKSIFRPERSSGGKNGAVIGFPDTSFAITPLPVTNACAASQLASEVPPLTTASRVLFLSTSIVRKSVTCIDWFWLAGTAHGFWPGAAPEETCSDDCSDCTTVGSTLV